MPNRSSKSKLKLDNIIFEVRMFTGISIKKNKKRKKEREKERKREREKGREKERKKERKEKKTASRQR